MKPFIEYDLRSILDRQWTKVQTRIQEMSNEEIMANDLEILAENLFQEFFIETIEINDEDFSKRSIKQEKIKKRVDPFWRSFYGKDYVEKDGIVFVFYYPYQGDRILFKCRASTVSVSPYPEILVDNQYVSFRIIRALDEMKSTSSKEDIINELNRSLDSIKSGIGFANNDVKAFNQSLKEKALQELRSKKEKTQSFFDVANMFEVPIEKKEYAKKTIPLVRNISPIAHKYNREDYYTISDSDYNTILETIKHTASTYERTPSSYKSMQEEDLRNVLLASLNATYKGNATGEAFRNNGKTDICIEQQNRAAFVAECKMWTGQAQVKEAIAQLDSYLTWRDCKTALIFFVRRKNFIRVLETVKETLKAVENIKSVNIKDKNEFDCLYVSETNVGQCVTIRVMFFNLYCPT